MMTKFKPMIAALGAGLLLTSVPALAGITWYSPLTIFEDNNLDWYEDNSAVANNTLDKGDRLISVVQIDRTVNGDQTASALITGGELTGIVVVEVTSKVPVTPGVFFYTFGAPTNGLDAYLPTDLDGVLGNAGNGAILAAYFDTAANLGAPPICASLANCLGLAGDGVLWEVDGFGDDDAYWSGFGQDNITIVSGSPASTKVAFVNFALDMLYNGTGKNIVEQFCAVCTGSDQMIDLIGSADILGGQNLTNGAFARSDTDFQKAIPEPATLALLGVGLLGMGASLRRKVR